jgi:pimeloyl-ACP methyl ester carboxylesterase
MRSRFASISRFAAFLVFGSPLAAQFTPCPTTNLPAPIEIAYGPGHVDCSGVGDGAECLNLYLPGTILSEHTLLWIHGGGWSIPTVHKDDTYNDLLCRQLAACGIPVVSCDYNLSTFKPCDGATGTANWKKTIRQIKRVIRWIRLFGTQVNDLPSAIIVAGSSAGAHLAAMMATTMGPGETYFNPPDPIGFNRYDVSEAILFSPPLNFPKIGCVGMPIVAGGEFQACYFCPRPIDGCLGCDAYYRWGPIEPGYPCGTCFDSTFQEKFLGLLWDPLDPPLGFPAPTPSPYTCASIPTPSMPSQNPWHDASPYYWISGDEPDMHIYQTLCDAWIPSYEGVDFKTRFDAFQATLPQPKTCTVTTLVPDGSGCTDRGCQHAAEGMSLYNPGLICALLRDLVLD